MAVPISSQHAPIPLKASGQWSPEHRGRPLPAFMSPQAPMPPGVSPRRRPVAASAISPEPRGRPMPASLSQQVQSPGTPLRHRSHQCPDPSHAPFHSGAGMHYELHSGERMAPSQAARHANWSTSAPLLEIHDLQDSGQIGVTFVYNEEVKESLKETFGPRDGRTWDPDSRMWKVPAELFEQVKAWALSHFDEAMIRLPGQESAAVRVPLPQPASMHDVEGKIAQWIDPETWQKLYNFQKEGVRFALRHNGRALIADDMGTGKTVQAICVAACYNVEWPLLIVCPSSVTITWLEALYTWLSPRVLPKPKHIHVISSGKDVEKKLNHTRDPPKRHIVITSYDLAQKLQGYERHFGMIICDESHALKTRTSNRTQFFRTMLARNIAKRVLLLTGTPALSRPIELYTQIDMLHPGYLGSYEEFGEHFCGKPVTLPGGKKEYKGAKNKEELNRLLTGQIMLRRLKKDVLSQIPALQRSRISVLPDPRKLKAMEDVKEELRALKEGGRGDLTEEQYEQKQQQLLSKWYRTTGPAKLEAGIRHIDNLIEQGRKLVVFAHHNNVLDGLEEAVQSMTYTTDSGMELRVGHMRIDGKTSSKLRSDRVKTFQGDEHCRVALLSIKAAGAGITLSAANTVVFLELYWNPGDLTQAEARAHRIGQDQEVQVQYLVCPGSADDMIWSIVNSKLQVVGTTLDGNTAGTAAGLRITSTDDLVNSNWKPPVTAAEDDAFEVLPTPEIKREEMQQPDRSTPCRRTRSVKGRAESPPRSLRRKIDFDEMPDQAPVRAQRSSRGQRHGALAAGAGTGVFEEEEDGFDDALAGLDVDEAVAASQQGPQSQRSSHYEGSGWTGPPPEALTPAQFTSYFDKMAAQADLLSAQPAEAYSEPDAEDLLQDDIDSVLELHHRAHSAWQQAVGARTQRANPRKRSTPARSTSRAGTKPTKAPQKDYLEVVAPDTSIAARQPPAESHDRAVKRCQQTKRAGKGVDGQQQQQQPEAAASAWDYPQQPVTRRRRAPRKDVVGLTQDD
ncbi:g2574 [Coccomyxa viridis]|uniref:G2574 protein n=1 Tax=Coccomyxa viridis TaxID=1274662 RepID=A0ABP1FKN9_9CHLO